MITPNDIYVLLQEQISRLIDIREKKPGIWQVCMPFYHQDGDMIEVFISQIDDTTFRISDYGFTFMRLSFLYYEIDNLEMLIDSVIAGYAVNFRDGQIYRDVECENLFAGLIGFYVTLIRIYTHFEKLKAAEELCKIYFDIAAAVIGEEKVR